MNTTQRQFASIHTVINQLRRPTGPISPSTQAAEKTWSENEPERQPFRSQFVGSSQKEEKTQVVFITLTTIFVVIVIGCIIEVYRTNRAHKKRLERETDESIIWSKEQATKLMEVGAAAAGGKALLGYKPVRTDPQNPHPRGPTRFTDYTI